MAAGLFVSPTWADCSAAHQAACGGAHFRTIPYTSKPFDKAAATWRNLYFGLWRDFGQEALWPYVTKRRRLPPSASLKHSSQIPQTAYTSLTAKLWRWRAVTGWAWNDNSEHINVLELRATLTSIKWRVERLHQLDVRCLHLVDSLVVLHSLTRGRSSSRKMRRTLMRVNSYLLASGLHPLWGYVDTDQNPADRPSRRGVIKRFVRRV